MSETPTETVTADSLAVQDTGIRIPCCPRCGQPLMLKHGLSTGTFGQCPWEDCDAWVAHHVEVTSAAFDSREAAKEAYDR